MTLSKVLFEPCNLQTLAFSKVVYNEKIKQKFEQYHLPEYYKKFLWFNYINSYTLTCTGLLEYVDKTQDLKGALDCLLKHNNYCHEKEKFNWNIKADCDFFNINILEEFDNLISCNVMYLSKTNMLKFVMLYMYILLNFEHFLPQSFFVFYYNLTDLCFECDVDKMLFPNLMTLFVDHDDMILCINNLIMNPIHRCKKCSNFLFNIE
uniref:Sf55 n=1 Tax=Spodoptera frugiperda nuclear polyhedrosis virus TaxID=10455 RepID=A0A7G3W7Q6_NPVSF|nr:hypothetical protein [Spodoptera frugiperda multiple nucleopolyhedrovirus]QRN46167.1 Sf55 [Spodoptera frugiperda multiple nucleopolyhedrovirus]